jgi:1-acyl-sn-glycerol-3-phosphate acyltransferase
MAYWVLKIVLTPVIRLLFHVRSEGTQNVPRKGPVILASNHQSFIDSVFLPLVVRRRVTFVAKAEYFESWKTAWFFRAVGMIPLKRGGGPASARAWAAAKEVLDSGGVLGIYPEGTRSLDGRLYKGHTGVARLSIQCSAPVVPVAQFGTAEVQPIGATRLKLFCRVKVKMGKPLRWESADERDSGALRKFTDEIMAAIASLSGQEVVPNYAKRDKGRLSAPGSEADPLPPEGPDGTRGSDGRDPGMRRTRPSGRRRVP